MFWLIIAIFGIIGFIMLLTQRESSLGSLLILTIPLFCFMFSGFGVYPSLISQKAQIDTLSSNVETIRNAYYKEANTGTMIGGSLDNMQQSSRLSEYLIDLTNKKSVYNYALKEKQTWIDMPIMWWFGNTMFIDKRIKELELIK